MFEGLYLITVIIAVAIFIWGTYSLLRSWFNDGCFAERFFFGLGLIIIGIAIFGLTALLHLLENYLAHIGIAILVLTLLIVGYILKSKTMKGRLTTIHKEAL